MFENNNFFHYINNDYKKIKDIKIKLVNELLNDELLAINSYHIFHSIIKNNEIKKHIYEHILDENEHFKLLLEYLSENDYLYNLKIKDNNEYLNEIVLNSTDDNLCIEEIQRLEKLAIKRYKTAIYICNFLKDEKLNIIFLNNFNKEIEHYKDFIKYQNK